MAGLIGYRQMIAGLNRQLLDGQAAMLVDVQEAALEAAIAGEAAVKFTIDHTPSSLSPGKPNRNWTFHMNQSVDSKVTRNGNTINIRVGWIDIREGYFLIQEEGGTVHGTLIEPMDALIAGKSAVIDTLKGWGLKTT